MSHDHCSMMEDCARACHECQDFCLRTIAHCLDLGGRHASREHQTLLTDCAAACGLSHGFLHRKSAQHAVTCGACAEICRACEEDCRTMGEGDATMLECAEACRRCAEACEAMSGMGKSEQPPAVHVRPEGAKRGAST